MNNRDLTKSIQKFSYDLFVLYIIYATDSLLFSTNMNQTAAKTSQYVIMFLTALFGIRYFIQRRKKKDFLLLVAVCAFLFLSMFVVGDFSGGYFLKIALFLFAYFFAELSDTRRFLDAFLRVMKVIAVVSLIGFLFGKGISQWTFLPKLITVVKREYVSLFFTNIPIQPDFQNRNYGPFWEPGVYQAYLIMALFFCLFYQKRKNRLAVVLFTAATVTTFSTTGIIALFFLFSGYLLLVSKEKTEGRGLKWLIVLLLFAGGLYLWFGNNLWELVFRKLKMGTESASFSSRWNAIGANLYVMKQYPFFGCGPNKISTLLYLYFNNVRQTGTFFNVNTILAHFSIYGLPVGLYFLWNIGRFMNAFIHKNLLTKGLVFLTVICILSGENFMYSLFFNLAFFINPSHLAQGERDDSETVNFRSVYIKNGGEDRNENFAN